MKLQGRNLEPNMRGDDVKLLQSELRRLNLQARIVDPEGFFGSTTFLAVQEFQRLHRLEPTGIVDQQTAQLINKEVDEVGAEMFIVRGQVRRSNGTPMPGVLVRVLRKGLRTNDLLGQTTTDVTGVYSIEYRPPARPISLVVQASNTEGTVLTTSDVICKARPIEIVNLTPDGIFLGPSEYQQLQDRLAPILRREQIRIEALDAADVELLACAHDLNGEHIAFLVVSVRMARETEIDAEAFYALVRQGLPTVLIALVAQPVDILQRALETSVRENIVGADIRNTIPTILRGLQQHIVRLALRPSEPDRPTLGTLLDIAGVQALHKERIVSDYLKRTGTVEEFWTNLRRQPNIGDRTVNSIQHVLRLATITLNHEPLVRELIQMRDRRELGPDLRDLARLTHREWQSLIGRVVGGRPIGAPQVLGGDEEQRPQRFAVFLERMVEAIFPTTVLAHRLAESDNATFAPTIVFLRRHPDFDFTTMRVHEYLRDRPDAIDDPTGAITQQLRAVQRMMNIAPSFNKVAAVRHITAGIDSATAIRRMGAPQYLRTHGHRFSTVTEAQQFYTNAARQADTALLLLSQSAAFNPTRLTITAPHLLGEGLPDLEDLFGSLDLCQCVQCESVYGAAAYLVDILHFLMNRPSATPSRTALDVLFGNPSNPAQRRRGDIGHIELTCHNTNTMLPYVDLVNEILEHTIAPGDASSFQTRGEEDTLAVNPEHLNVAAYNTLAEAVYPWILPFDLWAAEARRYLAQLGIQRHQLVQAFLPSTGVGLSIDHATEYLGMTPRERAIVIGTSGRPLRDLWGLETGEFSGLLSSRRAAPVLKQSSLSYEELTAVLTVRFVHAGTAMRIQFAGADCNLDTATISGLNSATLDRLHRFVRLQRTIGWPIQEFGRLLEVLGITALNDDALLGLAQVKRVRESWNASWETLLTWWSQVIETQEREGKPSLYERIFSDPTINPPTVSIFALNNARTELLQQNLTITDHASEIATALAISVEDLSLLVTDELPDTRLNLANLTRLYSVATFTRGLKLRMNEYVVIRGLTGINPVGSRVVEQTDRFIRWVEDMRKVGIEPMVLDYVFRHRIQSSSAIWSEGQVVEFLAKLRTSLQSIAAARAFASDPVGERTSETLPLLLPTEIVNRTMALLPGNRDEDEDNAALTALIHDHLSIFLDPAEAIERLVSPGTLTTSADRFEYVLQRLLSHLIRVESEALVVENVATALGLPAEVADRLLRQLVTAPTEPSISSLAVFLALRDIGDDDAATTVFSNQSRAFHRLAKIAIVLNALAVPAEHVEFMLTRGPALGWVDLVRLPLDAQDSAETLINQWTREAALFRASASFSGGVEGLLQLLRLLTEPGEVELTRGTLLDRIAELTGWNRTDAEFLVGPGGFNLDFPSGFLDGQFLLQLKPCFALLSVLGVSAEEACRWADLTAPIEEMADNARAIKQAVRAKYLDQQQWLAVAKPIRNELREQQRAALVAHLVHAIRVEIPRLRTGNPQLFFQPLPPGTPPLSHMIGPAVKELQWRLNSSGILSRPLSVTGFFDMATSGALSTFQEAQGLPVSGVTTEATWDALDEVGQRLQGPNDLYAHFLIDVEMDSCMLTSRLVQATNSVQLFVQRCLLNLEPEVELTPEDAKEWAWMKNYRVWEANRKVFLYPENWIEPELRDDKTPFFRQLESGLLQDEVTDATVEREYLKYLQELDRVAQLEISGLYREWEVDRDILHVFGRTRNTPHLYYYRRWINQRYWTPWEKVDVDIEGDHLVPVVWNRRLYLFWPMFMERALEDTALSDDKTSPKRYHEIRLAWSEYRDGKWSVKRVSDSILSNQHEAAHSPETAFPMKEQYAFWAEFTNDANLQIGTAVSTNQFYYAVPYFRFHGCNASPELVYDDQVVIAAPPGTQRQFNAFKEVQNNNVLELAAVAVIGDSHTKPIVGTESQGGGFATRITVNEQVITDSATILKQTPGEFSLITSHAEQPLASRHPFFYQDSTCTFFVIPNGGYSGGFGVGDVKGTLQPTHDAVPVELPDSVIARVAMLVGRTAGRGVHRPAVGEPLPDDDLLAPRPSSNVAATRSGAILSNRVAAILEAPVTVHAALPMSWEARFFRFDNFYHPYVCLLIEQLNRHGVEGILRPDPEKEPTSERREQAIALRRQLMSEAFFNTKYEPNSHNVVNVYGASHKSPLTEDEKDAAGPLEEFDFSYGGAYSIYNWELFFHVPFLIAKRLSANRRFAEAQRWFHYIFDPTYTPASAEAVAWPERVWQIKPFFEHGIGKSIEKSMLLLKSSGLSQHERAERNELRDQIEAWRKTPFNPHLIARIRNEAYMKTVVMAYLDNLIAWADDLFRQDTRESINEATQLYVLASEILGERPREISAHEGTRKTTDGQVVNTFEQLRGHLDAFSNVLVDLETTIYPMDNATGSGGSVGHLLGATDFTLNSGGNGGPVADLPLTAPGIEPPDDGTLIFDFPLATPVPAVLGPTLFFCIPKNDKLLAYWDTVADRLFKIRHCMNIEGVERQLALFSPPIDPGLLVKAAAAGLDIGSVLSDLNTPSPIYRFQVLVQKASELVNEVKSLGTALLSILEKRDAEELAILRSTQELRLLKAIRDIKLLKQIDEAKHSKESLDESKKVVESRLRYYLELAKEYTNEKENEYMRKLEDAKDSQAASQNTDILRAAFGYLPDFDLGVEGISSPVVKARWGSSNIMSYMGALSQASAQDAYIATYEGNKALTDAGHFRRQVEWTFQASQASMESSQQIEKQIAAAQLRIEIAEQDLANHDLQVDNAKAIDEYMHSKYTNTELYDWMISQISAVYFQSYQLAYDLAKRAERCFRLELGLQDTSFIQFGYWDSLKKGLLVGERLTHDLKRMEVAYLDQNRREYEISQHFSLALLDARALLQLRQTGECEFSIPELAFDITYPGHYMRRIKSASLTLPCVTGPHTNVSARLTLLNNRVRTNGSSQQSYAYTGIDDPNFRHDLIGIQSIATSSGQNDSGLFQFNFQDERYLPFERAGAISTWRLSLPNAFRSFDYSTISDVILHLSYTAREGGDALRATVDTHVGNEVNRWLDEVAQEGQGLVRLFSLKHEFPSEFHRLLFSPEGTPQGTTLPLSSRYFPHFLRERSLTAARAMLVIKPNAGEILDLSSLTVTFNGIEGSAFATDPDLNGLPASHFTLNRLIEAEVGLPWELMVSNGVLNSGEVSDLYLTITYTVSSS